jgi:hypothetical protein
MWQRDLKKLESASSDLSEVRIHLFLCFRALFFVCFAKKMRDSKGITK